MFNIFSTLKQNASQALGTVWSAVGGAINTANQGLQNFGGDLYDAYSDTKQAVKNTYDRGYNSLYNLWGNAYDAYSGTKNAVKSQAQQVNRNLQDFWGDMYDTYAHAKNAVGNAGAKAYNSFGGFAMGVDAITKERNATKYGIEDEKAKQVMKKMKDEWFSKEEILSQMEAFDVKEMERKQQAYAQKYDPSQASMPRRALAGAINFWGGMVAGGMRLPAGVIDFASWGNSAYARDTMSAINEFSDASAGAKAGDVFGNIATTALIPTAKLGATAIKWAPMLSNIANGVKIGGAFGALDPIMQKWSEATFGDIAKGAGIGATIGGALPLAVPAVRGAVNLGARGIEKAGAIAQDVWTLAKATPQAVQSGIKSAQNTQGVLAPLKSGVSAWVKTLKRSVGPEGVSDGMRQAKIGNKVVQIPKSTVSAGITQSIVRPSIKTLAGRAVSPRGTGLTSKQRLQATANAERNVREYWSKVRTGQLQGDLSTLETTAQSIVNNIDEVGAKIGKAVENTKAKITLPTDTLAEVSQAMTTKGANRTPTYKILENFLDDAGGDLTLKEAFELKKIYQAEVGKLMRSGDAGTPQYSALVKWVDNINKLIDDAIEAGQGPGFTALKKDYRLLKSLVDDIANSAMVEGRRSPQTFTEQMGLMQTLISGFDSPLGTTLNVGKQLIAKTIGDANTRGGAWELLIKALDDEAVDAFKKAQTKAGKAMQREVDRLPEKPSIIKKTSQQSESPFKNNKGFISPKEISESAKKAGEKLKSIIPKKDTAPEEFYRDLVKAGNSPIVAQRETAKRFGTIRAMSASKAGTMELPDALVQEAKKYKSAEEFIKSKWKPVYHWTTKANYDSINTHWFDISKNTKWYAEDPHAIFLSKYSDNGSDHSAGTYGSHIVEAYINPNAKILDLDSNMGYDLIWRISPKVMKEEWMKTKYDYVIKKWYDAIDYWDWEIAVFNPSLIKTQSQLKQIYEQANKTKVVPKVVESKAGHSRAKK